MKQTRTLFITVSLFISIIFFNCNKKGTEPESIKTSAVLSVVSGKNQPGENGKKLQEPVIVKVTDDENNALENIQITLSIIDGGGTLDDYIFLSDSEGFAETYWTLGNGSEHIMKASITDRDYSGEAVYVLAQTEINIDFKWTSNISFPRLFDKDVVHDNRILESNNFFIFSDKSHDDAKIRFAKIAEETFHEVLQAFNLQSGEELGIIESDKFSKPKLFSNVNTVFPYGGFAFNTGYIYYALDSEIYLQGSEHFKAIYRPDIKHETVHIIQFLVGLDNLPNLWPDVWFSEGIAVYISDNRPPIKNIQELNEWRHIPGNDNPIKVHEWSDHPPQGRRYYYMFGLAVKYLLHEKGHRKTTTDVLDMYKYMHSSGNGFADAFEMYMGMSLQYYEDNFWDLITAFLNQ